MTFDQLFDVLAVDEPSGIVTCAVNDTFNVVTILPEPHEYRAGCRRL